MADYSAYHALAQTGALDDDPQRRALQPQVATPNFNPPVAPGPQGYQQAGSPYAGYRQSVQQSRYGGAAQAGGMPPVGGQEPGYFPQGAAGSQSPSVVRGITAQMGGLAVGEDGAGPARGHKKKQHRHAYHDLTPAGGSSQAFNGMPQGGFGDTTQYLNSSQGQQTVVADAAYAAQQPSPGYSPYGAAPAGRTPSLGSALPPADQAVLGSAQGKVDPEQIPSVPKSRDVPAQYYFDHVYPTMEKHLPPPATIPFVAHDQGNSSPKFARLTLNNIPSTAESLASTGLPLGLILQPLAPLQAGEQPIPVLDFGEQGPPRCRRCRTYINPFMTFRSGGNKLVCNMCTFPNEVTPEYFAPTDPSGVRVDRMQRPELMMGTVEFMVPKEYWAKEPVGLRWLFLIDVCQEAVNRGFLEAFCEGVITALYSDDTDTDETTNGDDGTERKRLPPGSKVGVVTYDKDMHFYNLSPHLSQAQMMVMTDLEDPFVPLSDGLFVDPYESKDIIKALLTQLPSLFAKVKNPEPSLLSSMTAAVSALAATGGKIICSLSTLPTWGPGRLFLRDDNTHHQSEAEKKLFKTEHPGYTRLATKMVESGIGVDFFLASAGGGYLDIATIGHLSAMSGGEIYYYSNFVAPRDTMKLSLELKHTVNRETGYQALMKVRCSNGLQVSSYHGSFTHHTFGADLEFGVIDEDKALGVLFNYDGKLDTKLDAHFQAALLYTTASGERRVRCCNIIAAVNEGAIETMKFVDQDVVVNIIAKEAVSKMPTHLLREIRGSMTSKTIDILAGYRKNFSGSHPPGQLVLPENLKEFSMYMLSLHKCLAVKAGHETSDRRVHSMRMIKTMGLTELSLYLYPRIIPIHNMSPQDGFPNETGNLVVPPALRASFSKVEDGGVYIVDNGQCIILWLHSRVSPHLLEDLFGPNITTLQSLSPHLHTLPVLETHLNAQVRNLLQYLSSVRGSKAVTIQLARQGIDGAEYEFARLLVEDRNNEAQSYVDWLVHVHRSIQLELSGQRKKEDGGDSGEGMLSGLAAMRPWGVGGGL